MFFFVELCWRYTWTHLRLCARYLFVFDLTGSFFVLLSRKCYGFIFKQLPFHTKKCIYKWKVAITTMGATNTHTHTKKIITMKTILIKHPSQRYEWWLSWWIPNKMRGKKIIRTRRVCPHKLLLLFMWDIFYKGWLVATHTGPLVLNADIGNGNNNNKPKR